MRPVNVRIAPVKPGGIQRSFFWFLMMAFVLIFLFQISIPIVIYNNLCIIQSQLPNSTFYSGLQAGNDVQPVYFLSLHQVIDDNIAILTCWGGSFLFLVAFMLLGCMRLKNLMVYFNTRCTCMRHDFVDDLVMKRAKAEADNIMKNKLMAGDFMKMSAEKPKHF
ncbi:unnamed protein product [Nezara viridula]|uniref:Uncharacterized protein n=1 Tax=Nezara viridula TaxID=85310 RepID=A0A9P0HLY4_NEZVI|nr:unnamed protein product [Nezara viridula]